MVKYFIIILFFVSLVSAQNYSEAMYDTANIIIIKIEKKEASTLEKIGVSFGVTVGYGIIDAILYPIAERNDFVNEYRMLQGAMITGITYALVKKYDYKTGASFLINVYCGIPDLVYYGFHPSEFRDDNMSHLKFIPTSSHKGKRTDLYSSSFIGFGFSLTLNF